MAIHKLMVIGAGQMGCGIVQVAAISGFEVIVYDLHAEWIDKCLDTITKKLLDEVGQGSRSEEEMTAIMERISSSNQLQDASAVDIVIEAISEDRQSKSQLFSKLDEICDSHVILASNTSSLSITQLASVTNRADRVVGMHFMNPVPVMPLVEVIRGLSTSDETYSIVNRLAQSLGKTPIQAGDSPGFISNRVLMPMINEAIFCVYEGVAEPQAVDQIMRLGMKHPLGPLALADLIGLDTCLAIITVLQEGFGDSKYRPCPLLRQYVHAGWLGRKSGRGFYIYD